jgi:acyl-CoA synthetase (AMP-forming)/AMP-acid ligase II
MTWRDLVITPAVSSSIFLGAGAITWGTYAYFGTGLLPNVLLFVAAQFCLAMITIRLIWWIHPLKDGVYSFELHPVDTYVFSLLGFLWITHLWGLFATNVLPPLIRKSIYSMLGGRFGRGLIAITGEILDPWLVEVKQGATVGHGTLVLGHAMTSTGELLLGNVEIGEGAVIGARSTIMPGVRVGNHSMVNAMSLVAPHTVIRPYEVWGGNPAVKLRDLPRPPNVMAPRSEVLIDNVLAIAKSHPNRVFAKIIRTGGEPLEISYRSLMRESARYANLYLARGLRPKDILVLLLGHGPELLYGYVGALRAGLIPSILAPISAKTLRDHHLPALKATLASSGAQFVLGDSSTAKELESVANAGLVVIASNEAEKYGATFESTHSSNPDEIVLLQHSSGTTGLKKGVALSNRAIVEQLRNYSDAIDLNERDRIISWLPLYHDMGLIACLLLPLACGVPVVMMSPFEWVADPVKLLITISKERGTLCWLPNFAYNFLTKRVAEDRLRDVDLRSMRAFINCSEPVRADSHSMFLERFQRYGLSPEALTTCYAMAENTFAVTQGGIREKIRVEEMGGRKVVSSGRVIAKNRVRIVDSNRLDVPDGTLGEIAIQSKSMLTEYYRRADLTAAAITDGWYFTGDLGWMMDGHLFVTGRKKDLIICAGKNIDPGDIEEIASNIDGVLPGRVVAFGIDSDEKGTQELVVMAETQGSDASELGQIRVQLARTIRERLGVTVDRIEFVPHMSLVKSSSGKIARSANRDRYLAIARGGQHVVLEETRNSNFTAQGVQLQ